jgi:glyoxylase I family protein
MTTAQQNLALQPIAPRTTGVHHIALRSTDLARSKAFYIDTLGFQLALELDGLFICLAGGTALAVRGPDEASPAGDSFDPFRVGLDHVALACPDEAELERVAHGLAEAGIENTGVKLDETLGKRYVAFKDPDRIAWEYYMV